LIAAIGSFGVYAIPLVGPHALSFLGESLLQGDHGPVEYRNVVITPAKATR
jgi:hypothetical protein